MADIKFQTSFIPKKPVADLQKRRGGLSLFTLVSIIIFLIVLGVAGWVYLEKSILQQQIADQQNIIETNKSGLVTDNVTIEDIIRLNARMNVANTLLTNHVVVTPVFDFLQGRTLKNIRFKNFSFSSAGTNSSGQTGISIQMSGIAQDFKMVASQADEFGKPEWKNIIQEPAISSLNLNADGSVSFVFSAFIVADSILYKNNLSRE